MGFTAVKLVAGQDLNLLPPGYEPDFTAPVEFRFYLKKLILMRHLLAFLAFQQKLEPTEIP